MQAFLLAPAHLAIWPVETGQLEPGRCRPGNHSDFSVFPNFSLGVWQSERVRKTWNEVTNHNSAVLWWFKTPILISPQDKKQLCIFQCQIVHWEEEGDLGDFWENPV